MSPSISQVVSRMLGRYLCRHIGIAPPPSPIMTPKGEGSFNSEEEEEEEEVEEEEGAEGTAEGLCVLLLPFRMISGVRARDVNTALW